MIGLLALIGLLYGAYIYLGTSNLEKSESLSGEELVRIHGCRGCHQLGSMFRAPELEDLYNIKREFTDGTSEIATKEYLLESILFPNKKIVLGYTAIMPSYLKKIDKSELDSILSYITKSNKPKN